MTQSEIRDYPNLAQSIAITGIIIMGMILLSPINIIHNKLIDKEASMLAYYLLTIGIPCWIVYSIRKRKKIMKHLILVLKISE